MKLICPHCGNEILVKGNGRPRVNLNVQKVLDTLRSKGNVSDAAKQLQVGRGTLYRLLKPLGLNPSKIAKEDI